MYYYRTDEKKSKVMGALAAVLYIALWIALMFLLKFSFEERSAGEGLLVDFGDTESASGLHDPSDSDVSSPAESGAPQMPDQIMTQDFEDVPTVEQPERQPAQRPAQQPRPSNNAAAQPQPAQEPARQVNPQALFPGRTPASSSTSEGSAASGTGNQGSPDGSPQGSHDGTGGGGGGTGFDLAGRSVAGALPAPTYSANRQGRVVVEITVDSEGKVRSASYRARGSTTNDSELVSAAIAAALRSRFNAIEGDGVQTGTITYNFKLK